MSWHVLTDGTGFWGQKWEVMNTALRRPRSVLGGLQEATLCNVSKHRDETRDESRLALAILGVELYAVEVDFVREPGKDVQLVLKGQAEGRSRR